MNEKWVIPEIEEFDLVDDDSLSPVRKDKGCGIIPSYQVACDKLVCC